MRTLPNERLGSNKAEDGPERKCILSGAEAPRGELLRLALSPDGDVLPDAQARAPGRGAWVGVTRPELDAALVSGKLKGALARAFKGAPLNIPDNLGALAEDALRRAVLQRLGLELRAGKLILGSDRIAQQARGGAISWLGHASDASDDGCRKLDQAFRVGMDAEGTDLVGVRLPLDRAALSVALGRDNVVHLALADDQSAERVSIPVARLVRFLGAEPAAEEVSTDEAAPAALDSAVNDIEYEG